MDLNQFKEKVKAKFPDERFKIVRYGKNSYEDSELICGTCGRHIIVNTGELFRNRRKHICSKCHYLRKDSLANREIVIQKFLNKGITEYSFFFQEQKNHIRLQKVQWVCPHCARSNINNVIDLLRDNNSILCGHCQSGSQKDIQDFQFQLDNLYPNHFLLISGYKGATSKIKVKCLKCGFIRDVRAQSLLQHGYCPKCGKVKSKGEQYISEWLQYHKIEFEPQKYFKNWKIGLHYYDFYIPSYNLLLEYNGRQHYEEIDFFEPLALRQDKDRLKRDAALSRGFNFCSIKYTCFSDLDSILSDLFNSTTIPEGSRGKLLEIETIHNLDEDIV